MSVTTKNAQALGWKYPDVGGISTREGVITEWPDSLPELTQELVDSIEAEYEEKEAYKNKRLAEYPTIEECVHALLDTDHLEALQAKRTAVKEKYPK
jgi:hypothetical protein|tara:strand:- start:744 stop:1034 length:291 start_codon:yes stop_codon:yes gene_type:complete